ncbi:MAG: MlaD family protein [Gammaproteobacteria bacterium]
MSERANPVVVGGFVIGALVLLVTGVLMFGSGALFSERVPAVAYFSGNVRGLQVGSSVEFRGVRVGTVTDIQLALGRGGAELMIPVYMELEPRSLTLAGSAAPAGAADAARFLDTLVADGLRARLDLKSFVTGQLAVGLDMYPHTEVALSGAQDGVYELPTVPSALDRVSKVLYELPLQDIASNFIDTLDKLARFLDDENLAALLRDAAATSAASRATMTTMQHKLGPLLDAAHASVASLHTTVDTLGRHGVATLDDYARLAAEASSRLAALTARLDGTLARIESTSATVEARIAPVAAAAVATLDEARDAIAGADSVLGEDSHTRYNLDVALEELAGAARALRLMAEELQRNPDALIRGKNL